MTSTGLVRSNSDIVQIGTGEVIAEAQTFSMVEYLASVTTPASLEAQKKLAAAYDKACDSLIGENDVQKEGARTFKKKSAWAKLGRHFNISTVVVSCQKEMLGETFCATVTVKGIAPWGQSAEGIGACATDEESGRRSITIADAIATAETRAHNRAISRLIAMGEVSAEEMQKERSGEKAAAIQASSGAREAPAGEQTSGRTLRTAADKLMPFGDSKGKKIGDLHDEELEKIAAWCQSKGKFPDLIDAIGEVLAGRRAPVAAGNVEEFGDFPGALEQPDDDLPF